MKRFLVGAFLATTMAFPAVSFASSTEDLQRQLIVVLTQLVTMLETRIAQLHTQNAGQVQVLRADTCPSPPAVPSGITCSSEWQQIRDLGSCHIGWSCTTANATSTGSNLSLNSPVISAIQGPTDVSVNISGTWKIIATSTKRESLTYSIVWGDEGTSLSQLLDLANQGTGNFSASNSFNHTYTGEGVYTIIAFVKNEDGNTSKATMTIYVRTVIAPPAPPPSSSGVTSSLQCVVANTSYVEGQSYYFSCSGLTACTADPGWRVCRSGHWDIPVQNNSCTYSGKTYGEGQYSTLDCSDSTRSCWNSGRVFVCRAGGMRWEHCGWGNLLGPRDPLNCEGGQATKG